MQIDFQIFGKKAVDIHIARSAESWIHRTNKALWKFQLKHKPESIKYEGCSVVNGTVLHGTPQQGQPPIQIAQDETLTKVIEYTMTMTGQDAEMIAKIINTFQSYLLQRK